MVVKNEHVGRNISIINDSINHVNSINGAASHRQLSSSISSRGWPDSIFIPNEIKIDMMYTTQ